MKFTITEMSVGEILERAVKIYFGRLPIFFAIGMIITLPTLALQLALPEMAISPFTSLVPVLPMIFLGPLGAAAMLRVIVQEYLGQPIGLGEAFKFALGRFLPLLGTGLLAGLAIALGMMLCCIPGIYLAVIWAMMYQVVVVEDVAGPAALGRSKFLVEGYFGRVFGVLILVGLVIMFLNGSVSGGLPIALPYQKINIPQRPGEMPAIELTSYLNFAIFAVAVALVGALVNPFANVVTTLLYFDLRNRKEAFNVEHIVAWLGQYSSWRDEPDAGFPTSAKDASDTGIKGQGNVPPPDTGVKDAKPNEPPTI